MCSKFETERRSEVDILHDLIWEKKRSVFGFYYSAGAGQRRRAVLLDYVAGGLGLVEKLLL